MTDMFFRDATDASLARMEILGLGRGGFQSRWGGNATLTDLKAWRDAAASSSLLAAGAKSCAVVGASSSLLRATDGPEIDMADFVIRINNAPLPAAFRAQLGTRTSLLVTTFPDVRPHSLPHELHSHAPLLLDAYDFHDAHVLFYCHVPYSILLWLKPWTATSHTLPVLLAACLPQPSALTRPLLEPARGKSPAAGPTRGMIAAIASRPPSLST